MKHKIAIAGLGIASILLILSAMAGCSAITNTIAGLTTPQSTISGSNYVYYVDPMTQRFEAGDSHITVGDVIRPGDNFEIDLDFAFLRYLQAVDPYVVVYSEVWMGKSPRPVEGQKTLSKVLLIKEGLAQNARLPQLSGHLLDPVTLTEDDVDVSATIKVVVLSKYDNKETVKLVEGLAGAVGMVAPQWSLLAGTAAAAMSAFISQNRDKIEFEHTFTFNPSRNVPVFFAPHDSMTMGDSHAMSGILRESQIVVLKGESAYRVVPYNTWYYYVWPFNWFGQYTDIPSRRFEHDEKAQYDSLGEIVRLPINILKSFFIDVPEYSSTTWPIFKPVLWIGNLLFPIDAWFGVERNNATYPDDLAVDGSYIVFCAEPEPDPIDEEYRGLELGWLVPYSEARHRYKEADRKRNNKQKEGKEKWRLKPCRPRHTHKQETGSMQGQGLYYAEKTHLVLRIKKTDYTRGTFSELMGEQKEHLRLIQEVTTTRAEAKVAQEQRTTAAFAVAQRMVKVEQAKSEISGNATNQSSVPIGDSFFEGRGITESDDKEVLRKKAIDTQVRSSTNELWEFGQAQFKAIDILGDEENKKKAKAAFQELIKEAKEIQRKRWNTSEVEPNYRTKWGDGWNRVLDEVARRVRTRGCTEAGGCFDPIGWKELQESTSSLLNAATISIADSQVLEGDAGTKTTMTFTVSLDPPIDDTVTVKAEVKAVPDQPNAANVGLDYTVPNPNPMELTFPKGKTKATFNVEIIGNATSEPNNKIFSVELSGLSSGKGKVMLGRSKARGTIIDDDTATISIGSCVDVKDGDVLKTKQFTVKSDLARTNPIKMFYKTVSKPADPQPAEENKDYVPIKDGQSGVASNQVSTPVMIDVNQSSQRTTDRKFYLQLYGLTGPAKFSGGAETLEQECVIDKK